MNKSWFFINLKLCLFIKISMDSAIETVDGEKLPTMEKEMEKGEGGGGGVENEIEIAKSSEMESGSDADLPISGEKRRIMVPPLACKGMTALDKTCFKTDISVPCLTTIVTNVGAVRKLTRNYFVHLEQFRPIQPFFTETGEEDPTKKNIILDPDKISSFNSFNEKERKGLEAIGITEKDLMFGSMSIEYNNWRIDDIVAAILPDDVKFSGFSLIGHIVHLNLRDDLLKYKHVIGRVLLDKIKNVKTVINKVSTIDNTYRSFKMELLCGKDDMVAELKENYCTFELDFSKVYWNPRLSTEHERIVKLLKYADVLYDVFAGIGPFAIPAAKKGCTVLANDLNPDAIEWLEHNIKLNKVEENIEVFNLDGSEFIKKVIRAHLSRHSAGNYNRFSHANAHITMNLPNVSHTFIPNFFGLLTRDEFAKINFKIFLHIYFFLRTKTKEPKILKAEAKEFVETALGVTLGYNLVEVRCVRHVAPNKNMFRVSCRLGRDVLVRSCPKRKRDDSSDTSDS